MRVYEEPDADYIRKRDAFIPFAEKYANRQCGVKPAKGLKGKNKLLEDWNARWNRLYHNKMNELARGGEKVNEDGSVND